MKIVLSKRFQYENYDLTEVDLDLHKITPVMVITTNQEFVRRGNVVPIPKMDPVFCTIIASKILKIPEAVLTQMPYEDWDAITSAVQYFLLHGREPETALSPEAKASTPTDSAETSDVQP
jgi:hypothetical protein